MCDAKYAVGDRVILRDVNERRGDGPTGGVVTKVGRRLVTVTVDHGREEQYRIETGRKNDRYEHGWIQTPDEYADEQRRGEILRALREAGVELRMGSGRKLSTDILAKILDVVTDQVSM